MAQKQSHSEGHHVTPLAIYYKIGLALFLLTFLTVGAHSIREHIQPFAALVAFSIAGVKAYLVMAWFMHLKYDKPSNRLIFSLGFIFLAVLIGFCALDIVSRVAQNSIL